MSWATRKNGYRYYYRMVRIDGKLVRKYGGAGLEGERQHALDIQRRAELKKALQATRAEEARVRGIEGQLQDFSCLADLMARLSLVAAGYRQWDRGRWMRRKGFRPSPGAQPSSESVEGNALEGGVN